MSKARIQNIESPLGGELITAIFGKESLFRPDEIQIIDILPTEFPRSGGNYIIVVSDRLPNQNTPWNSRYISIFGIDLLGINRSPRIVAKTGVFDSTSGLMTYPDSIRRWLRSIPDMPIHMLEEDLIPFQNWQREADLTLAILYRLIFPKSANFTNQFLRVVEKRWPGESEFLVNEWCQQKLSLLNRSYGN